MRTNRERLIEWLQDMLFEKDGWSDTLYALKISSYRDKAESWADRIMEDINAGIIASENEPEYVYGYAPLATSEEKFPTEEEARLAYWMYLGPIRRFRRLTQVSSKWEEVPE